MSSCDPILCVSMRLRPLASYCDRLKAQVDVFFPFDAFFCLALSLSLSRSTSYKLSSIVHKIHVKKRTRILMNTRRVRIASPWECRTLSFPLCMCVCVCIRRAFQCVRNKRDANFSCVNYFSCYYRPFFYHNFIVIYDRMECLYCVCERVCVCLHMCL